MEALMCEKGPFSASQTQEINLSTYRWNEILREEEISLHPVTKEKSSDFLAICKMYEIGEEELIEELDTTMTLWSVHNHKHQSIGAIQIDSYPSLTALELQISDKPLAAKLFSKGQFFEISYALDEKYQGQGIGSKMVATWVNHARRSPWGKHVFAVVSCDNKPSIRLLEKNGFSYRGVYIHEKTKERTFVYTLD